MRTNQLNNLVVKEIGLTLLEEGKILKVKAEGYSMFPVIKPGYVLLIEPLEPGYEPQPGEIVAWKRDSGLVLHRLVRIFEKGGIRFFVTRGDSCALEDDPVTIGQIAGKVRKSGLTGNGSVKTLHDLNKDPAYLTNRLRVWLIINMNKIKRRFR